MQDINLKKEVVLCFLAPVITQQLLKFCYIWPCVHEFLLIYNVVANQCINFLHRVLRLSGGYEKYYYLPRYNAALSFKNHVSRRHRFHLQGPVSRTRYERESTWQAQFWYGLLRLYSLQPIYPVCDTAWLFHLMRIYQQALVMLLWENVFVGLIKHSC